MFSLAYKVKLLTLNNMYFVVRLVKQALLLLPQLQDAQLLHSVKSTMYEQIIKLWC